MQNILTNEICRIKFARVIFDLEKIHIVISDIAPFHPTFLAYFSPFHTNSSKIIKETERPRYLPWKSLAILVNVNNFNVYL
jgi:hypothetical protein